MEKIVIIGASGHAKVVIDIVEQAGRFEIVGLVDRDSPIGSQVCGYPVLSREQQLPALARDFDLRGLLIAIGDNFVRSQVADRVGGACPGLSLVSAVHPRATLARDVTIGDGTVIMAGAVVNPGCRIGLGCILNTNSSLDHDCRMDDFSSLAPRVAIGGNCRVGSHSAIGIGATMIHGVSVGEHVVVGAGSTVLHNVERHQVVYGTPARVVRPRTPGDRYL
jgi:sugar O-acyltransferase (sialic acid O-acetyltransferase NeuD family)